MQPEKTKSEIKKQEKRRKRILAERAELGEEFAAEDNQILQELHNEGRDMVSILEYFDIDYPFTTAETSILIKWLNKTKLSKLKEVLVSALKYTENDLEGQILVKVFENPSSHDDLRWNTAYTIATGKVKGVEDWVVDTLLNAEYAYTRETLCYAVIKMQPYDKAVSILMSDAVFDEFPCLAADALGIIGRDQSIVDFLQNKRSEYLEALEKESLDDIKRSSYKSAKNGIPDRIKKIQKRIEKA